MLCLERGKDLEFWKHDKLGTRILRKEAEEFSGQDLCVPVLFVLI